MKKRRHRFFPDLNWKRITTWGMSFVLWAGLTPRSGTGQAFLECHPRENCFCPGSCPGPLWRLTRRVQRLRPPLARHHATPTHKAGLDSAFTGTEPTAQSFWILAFVLSMMEIRLDFFCSSGMGGNGTLGS